MKTIPTLLLAVTMLLMLAACGSPEEAVLVEDAPAAAEPMGEAADDAAPEPSAEPADEASEEPTNEPTAEASAGPVENAAHGGAPGAISQADYQAYLKAWIDAEQAADAGMTDEEKAAFYEAIDGVRFAEDPGALLFAGGLTTGSAMTYDEFVAADGVY